ncbi:hypothetical protein DIPPA_33620 [Diplonema papillatum]|nr:hypothetical protein DIPPA_33620 [Diplonema papillatum]|eukprot:gene20451-31485_t
MVKNVFAATRPQEFPADEGLLLSEKSQRLSIEAGAYSAATALWGTMRKAEPLQSKLGFDLCLCGAIVRTRGEAEQHVAMHHAEAVAGATASLYRFCSQYNEAVQAEQVAGALVLFQQHDFQRSQIERKEMERALSG